jgi:hypothetical protein
MYGLSRNYPTWRPYANDNPNYPAHTDWDESQHALLKKSILGEYVQLYKSLNSMFFIDYQTPIKGLSTRFQYTYGVTQGERDLFRYTWNTYTYDEATDKYNVTEGLTTGSHERNFTQTLANTYLAQLNYKIPLANIIF